MRVAYTVVTVRLSIVAFAAAASLVAGTACRAQDLNLQMAVAASDTPRVRPRAIEYSDWYSRRLTIHRWGSYTMLPLFAGEYYIGDRLLNGVNVPSWYKPAHVGIAGALGVLFTVNTATGAWNLWDSRADPASRTLRYVHTGLMLASDAGFSGPERSAEGRSTITIRVACTATLRSGRSA